MPAKKSNEKVKKTTRTPPAAHAEVVEPVTSPKREKGRKRILVTGATGFIGQHVVRALLDDGYQVRALCRGTADELAREGVEIVRGDVLDIQSITEAMVGVDAVVHGAGTVSREDADRPYMMKVHITGTRFVVGAAASAGISRIVNLSTSGVVALSDASDMVMHEEDPVPFELLVRYPYYLSKFLADRAAADAIRLSGAACELITLNPSLVLGPGDVRGSSTQDVRRFLGREIPIVPSGGFSFVDVRDVAQATLRALTHGRPGERYLLGTMNLTFAEFFQRLEEVSGVAGPSLPVALPGRFSRLAIGALERLAGTIGAKLPVSALEAEMASRYWYVDARKAIEELDFSPRDPMQTLLDTVRDIRGLPVEERFAGRTPQVA